jgi:hypothetical protein
MYPDSDYRQYAPSLLRSVRPLLIPSEKNRRSTLGPDLLFTLRSSDLPLCPGSTHSVQVIEAEVAAADVAYANVSVDPGATEGMDTSTHSVIYPLESAASSQRTHDSPYAFGDGEDYGSPETEQEAMV